MNKVALTVAVGVLAVFPLFALAKAAPKDTKPPVIASHSDVVVVVNGVTSSVVTYTKPTATDDKDGSVPVTCAPVSGSTFSLGSTEVTCTAKDAAGNTAHSTFDVKVKDNTPPVVTVSHIASSNANPAQAAAGDTVTVSFTTSEKIFPPIVLVNSKPFFVRPSGSETTWQATYTVNSRDPNGKVYYLITVIDKAGNPTLCSNAHLFLIGYCPPTDSSSVTVTPPVPPTDTVAPVIAAHGNVSAEATSPTGAGVTYTNPTATDNVDGTDPVTCLPASGSTFAVGTTVVTCTTQDNAGNAATPATFAVTVTDTTAPAITPHADVSVQTTDSSGAVVIYTAPTATDLVDGSVAVSCLPASGDTFTVGTTTVTCIAIDAHSNTTQSSFNVGVYVAVPTSFVMASQSDESNFCTPDWRTCYTGGTSQVLIPLGSGAGLAGTLTSVTIAKDPDSDFANQSWALSVVCYTDAAYTIPCSTWFTTSLTTSSTDNKHWSASFNFTFDPTRYYQLAINDNGWNIGAFGSATQPYWVMNGLH